MPQPVALLANLTRDEKSRQSFVTNLRAHVLTRLAGNLRERYQNDVLPGFVRQHGRHPSGGNEVHLEMREQPDFRFFSAVRCNAQEMVFASVIPAVERDAQRLSDKASKLRKDTSTTSGSLQLNPDLVIPRNVTAIDVHLAPGSYHSEYGDDDVAAGAIYDHATNVFAFRQFGDRLDDIGQSMSNFIRLKFPDFKPKRIVDCGCTVGHNTLPWAQLFPQAEVFGIDVAPGVLRYASARAQTFGIPAHFRQMNATALDFDDGSVDVVYSSMFLHELPLKDIRAFFREAHRVLKPGGLLWSMELPPNQRMGAYESFYLDWDSYYNNEPFYKPFRDQNYRELCSAAGFAPEDFIEATLPRYSFVGEQAFKREIEQPMTFDSQTGRMDPKGTRWYGFGSWKAAA